ncbi:MAG: para-aminobenzoate synthetase / 4-amino-4-deoxychorismate lyase, partial [Pseudonocardiales bacterium]|nr:para-aminobenzoate synthetase / 4-amino-4-deoxychorismate lyase [Pseudonocardiales bacterium]
PAPAAHLAAVERAVEHIRAGDIYQVNVCTRLSAPFAGAPVDLFAEVAGQLEPAYGAFVDSGDRAVVSASPELFLQRRGRDVLTAPIKGTRPRTDGDDAGAAQLRRSAKDAAENVMIVDLMRNDLGRVCVTGTVAAITLLDVEAHPGVWHLVSRVRGRLRDDVADSELLDATFPPGSVTGAPKLRAIRVIEDLEAQGRGAYTGAIGFVSPSWGAEFSVAIRTFEVAGARVELGVGGGITADSVPMLEWHECLHKAAPLIGALGAALDDTVATAQVAPSARQLAGGLLETVLVVDGHAVRLADPLARLDRSCRELFGDGLPGDLAARALAAAAAADVGRSVLRIVRTPASATVTCAPARPAALSSVARIVSRPGGLWRHKWADRADLEAAERAAAAAVPVFVAGDGTVLETSRGNLFLLCRDGSLVTPPLRDDLLPGVTRRALLDLAHDQGRRVEIRGFDIAELVGCTPFWTSSLSGAVPIHSVDGLPTVAGDEVVYGFAAELLGGGKNVR